MDLEGHKDAVICYNNSGFSYQAIGDVAFVKYTIPTELLRLGAEYSHNR